MAKKSGVAQVAERRSHKPKVAGSTPAPASKPVKILDLSKEECRRHRLIGCRIFVCQLEMVGRPHKVQRKDKKP